MDALEQKKHPLDPEAEAAILYQSCVRSYIFNNNTNAFDLHSRFNLRIKIYNQEGLHWANINIPYHTEGNVTRLRAFTYNLVNGQAGETRLSNRDTHTADLPEAIKNRIFAMPAVSPGSIIDIEYELIEPAFYYSLRPFFKQHSIPVDYSMYRVEIPEYFTFNKEVRGVPLPMDVTRGSGSGTINLHIRQRSVDRFGIQSAQPSSRVENYIVNIETFISRDIPALRNEPYVPAMKNYRNSINYELSSIHFPRSREINVAGTWDDITKMLMVHQTFGRQLTVRTLDLESIIEEALTKEFPDRVNMIYYYVRDNFTWNGIYGEHAANGISKLLSEGGGNVGDINLLLINLLKQAEVDVKPVVLSSRHNGFLNISYPTYAQINYVIAAVNINDDIVFLDATDKHLLAGYLPVRAWNLHGIMINSDNSATWMDIDNPNHGSLHVRAMAELEEDMKMNCRVRLMYSDYYSVLQRSRYNNSTSPDDYIDDLHKRYPQIEIAEYQISGEDEVSNSVTETMTLSLEGFAEQIGGMIYISPLMLWRVTENRFISETREFPVFYDYTGSVSYLISIRIPGSWMVESIPGPMHIALPDNKCRVIYQIDITGNDIIQIHYRNIHNESIISPQYYESLRELMITTIEKQNERIVLKKP